MPIKKYKPTSPGRRAMSTVVYRGTIDAVRPHRPLTRGAASHAGRNNQGRITVRHQGGGSKRRYRSVDFRQQKLDVPGRIESVEYDPYRTAFIALVVYRDGDRRYILASRGMKPGDEVVTASAKTSPAPGNRMQLKHITVGTQVHNVELRKGSGGRLARAAGSYAEVLAHEGGSTSIRLASKEVRKVSSENFASVGQLSNPDHNLASIGKAGRSRLLGIRPTVRGSAMNPVDHPYGGGEGKQPRGTKRPKTLWGKVTGGRKTRRRKKWSNVHIMQRRPKKR